MDNSKNNSITIKWVIPIIMDMEQQEILFSIFYYFYNNLILSSTLISYLKSEGLIVMEIRNGSILIVVK